MSLKILLIVNLLIILNLQLTTEYGYNRIWDQQNMGSNLHRVRRFENPSRIIFRQINITSIKNKFDLLMNILNNEIDIL